MLALIWWIYDGYAWLTNAISTDRLRFRLLLLGGMGGFLMIALATPHAYERDGLLFGLGYLAVTALHAGMFVRGVSADELRAILRIAPFNLLGAALVVVGGALGGDAQTIIWALVAVMLWLTPRFTSVEGLVIGVSHFVERHGLVVIVALGESIVVLGVGTEELELDAKIVLFGLLALALSAALWWVYFSDENAVEEAFARRRPRAAPAAGADRVRVLALRPPAGRDRRRGGAEEGDRASRSTSSTTGSRPRSRWARRSTSPATPASARPSGSPAAAPARPRSCSRWRRCRSGSRSAAPRRSRRSR